MIKIQLVDDETHILKALQRILRRDGWEVHIFSDIEEALAALEMHQYAVVVVDYQMPQFNGVTYLQFVKQRQPDAVRMVLSAHVDTKTMMQAINLAEVYRFLPKPWNDFEIVASIQAAIDLNALRVENKNLIDQVRQQQALLSRQGRELSRLEQENPGITRVERDADGNVLVDDVM